MHSVTRTRTILLADLVGSSVQVTGLETDQGAEFINDAMQPIEAAVLQHDGTIIKFTGDGYLATFESADDALEAAEQIRNHFLRQRYTPAGIVLDGVRIVINTSDVVIEDNDIIGDGVIVAARLEKNVPANTIWVTAATREVCSNTIFSFEEVGEIQVRGRTRLVRVYALESSDTNYVENGITLMITEMHRYIEYGERLEPGQLNDWLLKWNNLHREAVANLKGRVRHFIADKSLMTFSNPDEAYQGWLNLCALVNIHNEKTLSGLPPYTFRGAMAHGDLILSPTGIVGPLVNRTFDVLNATPREGFCLNESAYNTLENYQSAFEPYASTLYVAQKFVQAR
jgi:class 3 adenylate cyclase